ncbi:MAG: NrsF family protein [Candidatus Puniceispirillales bacterium]
MTRTDHLIDRLSAEPEIKTVPVIKLYAGVLAAVTLAIGLIGLWALGQWGNPVREGYPRLMLQPLVAAKQLIPLLIVATAIPLVILLARPETTLAGKTIPVLTSLIILPVMMVAVVLSVPAASAAPIILGSSLVQCLVSIPLLALPIVLAQIAVLRHGAVTKPRLAGALAGVTAGGLAAAIYAMVCIEDNPGFYGLWYSVDILITGAIGAVLGKLALKW